MMAILVIGLKVRRLDEQLKVRRLKVRRLDEQLKVRRLKVESLANNLLALQLLNLQPATP